MASIYKTTNASIKQEAEARKYFKKCMDDGTLNSIEKQKPHAVAYGLSDLKGNRKLFKWAKVFYSAENFDRYVKEHRQIVLAVYSHR